jgi:hypothetical protein
MERKFAVIFGAHGSPHYGALPPTEFPLTLAEAEAQAADWRDYASTVGGTADIIERP